MAGLLPNGFWVAVGRDVGAAPSGVTLISLVTSPFRTSAKCSVNPELLVHALILPFTVKLSTAT
ncbi:hypothetical protein GCM10023096_10590 [Nonomuraea ferruginea]